MNTNKKCVICGGPHRTLAMACPKEKDAIRMVSQDQQEKKKREEMRLYSDIVKKTVNEVTPPAPTQIILGTYHSYKILKCIIHAHMINMARPGTYANELNKMLEINNLPTVNAPDDVPSGEIFGAKMATQMTQVRSQDSVRRGASASRMMSMKTWRLYTRRALGPPPCRTSLRLWIEK